MLLLLPEWFRPLALPSGIRVGVGAVCIGRFRSRDGADGFVAGLHLFLDALLQAVPGKRNVAVSSLLHNLLKPGI